MKIEGGMYALCLQVCAAETVVVLVEVHHLEAVELVRDLLDLLLLAWLDDLHAFGVPVYCQLLYFSVTLSIYLTI